MAISLIQQWVTYDLASRLMVSRQTVTQLLHEQKSVTAEMAVRISRAVGGSPESWLRMQEALDIWEAEMKFKNNPAIAPVTRARHAIAKNENSLS